MVEKDKANNINDVNINIRDIELVTLNITDVDKKYDGGQIKRINKLEVKGTDVDEIFIIEDIEKLILSEADTAILELKMIAICESDTSIKELGEFPPDQLEEISYPLLAASSNIISFLTDKKFGVPFIVPPIVSKNK